MPRQPTWSAAGVYQPAVQPRRAYGPRRSGRCDLIEEAHESFYETLDARTVARYGGALGSHISEVIAIRMPRGGVRWLLVCPQCGGRTTRLYSRSHLQARRFTYACRHCWRLRYQSQYAGRRTEAHPHYLQAAMRRQIEQAPRDVSLAPAASERRHAVMGDPCPPNATL